MTDTPIKCWTKCWRCGQLTDDAQDYFLERNRKWPVKFCPKCVGECSEVSDDAE